LQDALEDPKVKGKRRGDRWRKRLKEDHFDARYKEVRSSWDHEITRLQGRLDIFSYEDEYGVTPARVKTPKHYFIDSQNTGRKSSGPVFGEWFGVRVDERSSY